MGRIRKIAIYDYHGAGGHIYEIQLGWQVLEKQESHSLVSRDIFEFEIIMVGYNLSFYFLNNDTFYGLHTESFPIDFKILPRDRSEEYIGFQCEEMLASMDGKFTHLINVQWRFGMLFSLMEKL